MQLAWEFYGSIWSPSPEHPERRLEMVQPVLGNRPPVAIDAAFFAEPLLRRFERGKSVQEAPVFPRVPGLLGPDMFSCFLRFFLGERLPQLFN